MTTQVICMNCENPFIRNGPYFTCGKCHGPCDTFRYPNYAVDENFYDATHNHQKEENVFGNPWDNELPPFRRRVPRPEPSKSTTLKKSQVTDQFRVFSYRILNFCSRSMDPFTWLEMLRDSKSKYDVKRQTKKRDESHTEKNGESSQESSQQKPL